MGGMIDTESRDGEREGRREEERERLSLVHFSREP